MQNTKKNKLFPNRIIINEYMWKCICPQIIFNEASALPWSQYLVAEDVTEHYVTSVVLITTCSAFITYMGRNREQNKQDVMNQSRPRFMSNCNNSITQNNVVSIDMWAETVVGSRGLCSTQWCFDQPTGYRCWAFQLVKTVDDFYSFLVLHYRLKS